MKPLTFIGKLSASKSMLNRALLIASYNSQIHIVGESQCEDVQLMQTALQDLLAGQRVLRAGSAGAVVRFLALRVSRLPGKFRIEGTERLFERPQDELVKILRQVGVEVRLEKAALEIEGEGWHMHGDTLLVPGGRSSQFASSVLLNSWGLPFDLYVSLGNGRVSEGYWRMSVQMAEACGMKIDFWDADFRVVKQQLPKAQEIAAEIDMSSAFALAAVAALSGHATFLNFPQRSLQPDSYFASILQSMGAKVTFAENSLKVEKSKNLNGVSVNLKSAPDLFPVLAALCALSEGNSDLFGAPHLIHKESDRLRTLAEWIEQLGRPVHVKPDGLVIEGSPLKPNATSTILNCQGDHRLAFAAAVFKSAGLNVEITNPESVSKSFPEFWDILGWRP